MEGERSLKDHAAPLIRGPGQTVVSDLVPEAHLMSGIEQPER
mgnify:CR=1 FL=1